MQTSMGKTVINVACAISSIAHDPIPVLLLVENFVGQKFAVLQLVKFLFYVKMSKFCRTTFVAHVLCFQYGGSNM